MRRNPTRRVSMPHKEQMHIRSANTNSARLWAERLVIRPSISLPMTLRWKSAPRRTASS
nr:MAG TPA: hypothetical protein [Caudoviricetes sp.]